MESRYRILSGGLVACVILVGCDMVKRRDRVEAYEEKINATVQVDSGFSVSDALVTGDILDEITGVGLPEDYHGLEHDFFRGDDGAGDESIQFTMPVSSVHEYLENLADSLGAICEDPDSPWLYILTEDKLEAPGAPKYWNTNTFSQKGDYSFSFSDRSGRRCIVTVDTLTGKTRVGRSS